MTKFHKVDEESNTLCGQPNKGLTFEEYDSDSEVPKDYFCKNCLSKDKKRKKEYNKKLKEGE